MEASIYTKGDRTVFKYTVADAIHYAREFLLAQKKPIPAVIRPGLYANRNEPITLAILNDIQLEIIVLSAEHHLSL